MVINLGTNDHLGTQQSSPLAQAYKVCPQSISSDSRFIPSPFQDAVCDIFRHGAQVRYLALVAAAAKVYGKATGFFLACGPMSTGGTQKLELREM